MSYPLYDFLLQKVKEETKQIDIDELCMTLNGLGHTDNQQDHYDEIYALMIHHECINNNGILLTIPFEGKLMPGNKQSKNILYNNSKLPVLLRQILYEYILYYKQTGS
jgi:hypothetical protein